MQFQVAAASAGKAVQLSLAPPSLVRTGGFGAVTVTATNTSNDDVLAPLLTLTTNGATLKLASQTSYQGESVTFLSNM